VLDDDDLVSRVIERMLRRHGHEVVIADNPGHALRLAQDTDFDIAIVDFHMPGTTGVQVLEQLRSIQPRCLRILITGELDLPMVKGALDHGGLNKMLKKPLDRDELIRAIDGALHQRERYREVREAQRVASRDAMRRDLQECLSGDYIQIALQPILRSRDGSVFAHEALLRSTHPTLRGPLPVLRAAEEHGMLPELSRVVIHRVAAWLEILPEDRLLFMNLHPDELGEPEALAGRLQVLARYAHRIVLEITERRQVTRLAGWEESVARTREMGFALAVDDLGAGYSSLSVLAELQPDFVKVDMSIVRGVDADDRKQRLMDLLCRFAEATRAQLVAEGVETAAEAEALERLGAHLLQGYYYGRPTLDVAEVLAGRSQSGKG
jgi:EAL domain-containing protein (putative c-di-GMP-specific phosphodiesterase class I)/CheY-like chemotaxis protein